MKNEDIDETLKTCRRLMDAVMFDNWDGKHIEDVDSEFRILYFATEVVVSGGIGSSTVVTDDERHVAYYASGRGPSLLEAVANWRARLVKGAQKKMVEHESFRKFVEERGLLA